MESKNKSWFKDLFLIFVATLVLYLAFAPLRPLANPDEGRYAEIPREMVANGDYVSPRLNDLPYFYKPPLFYWMQCASIKTFGANRLSIRLASSLTAVLGICLTYAAARALFGRRAGLCSALVLSTSLLYYVIGMIVTLDMAVSVFMSGAMFSFIVAIKKSGIWRKVLILSFFVFCALAVMTKGIIGILIPCAVAFLYVVAGGFSGIKKFFRTFSKSDYAFMMLGVVAFLAISIPWHVLASIATPASENAPIFTKDETGQGFFWYYIIHEHFLRYIDPGTSFREQPFWFFLVLAPVGILPWVFFLPRIFKNTVKGGQLDTKFAKDEFLYMAIWICFIVGFFSISSSKLVPYITAIYPAFAFILGVWIDKVWDNLDKVSLKIEQILIMVVSFIAPVALIVAFFILKQKPIEDEVISLCRISAFATSVLILIAAIALVFFYKRNLHKKFWTTFALGMIILVGSLNVNAPMGQRISAEKIGKFINENRKGEAVAIAFDYGFFQDLPVWLNECPMLIGEPPLEQSFGWMLEKSKHTARIFANASELETALKKHGKIWAVFNDKNRSVKTQLEKFGVDLNVREIYRNKITSVQELTLKK